MDIMLSWHVEVGFFVMLFTVKHTHILKLHSLLHTNTLTEASTCIYIQTQNAQKDRNNTEDPPPNTHKHESNQIKVGVQLD